jgi:hypothetical protein
MNHTFLFKKGYWQTSGIYTDSDNITNNAEGFSNIVHNEDKWILDSSLQVSDGDNSREITNLYEITPVDEECHTASWFSVNPSVGKLNGLFAIIGDVILSTFSSEDKQYSGVECIIRIDDDNYSIRGVLLYGEKKISSWSTSLKRVEQSTAPE